MACRSSALPKQSSRACLSALNSRDFAPYHLTTLIGFPLLAGQSHPRWDRDGDSGASQTCCT